MDLLQKQFIFSPLVARLILYAYQQGFKITLGEAWRSPETAEIYAQEGKGIADSNHCNRLAIDLNVFKDDVLLTDSAQYLELGDFWESLSDPKSAIKCVWGGTFSKPDGDHFSIEHNGIE
jgi:hypothetical protein